MPLHIRLPENTPDHRFFQNRFDAMMRQLAINQELRNDVVVRHSVAWLGPNCVQAQNSIVIFGPQCSDL